MLETIHMEHLGLESRVNTSEKLNTILVEKKLTINKYELKKDVANEMTILTNIINKNMNTCIKNKVSEVLKTGDIKSVHQFFSEKDVYNFIEGLGIGENMPQFPDIKNMFSTEKKNIYQQQAIKQAEDVVSIKNDSFGKLDNDSQEDDQKSASLDLIYKNNTINEDNYSNASAGMISETKSAKDEILEQKTNKSDIFSIKNEENISNNYNKESNIINSSKSNNINNASVISNPNFKSQEQQDSEHHIVQMTNIKGNILIINIKS